MIIDPKEDRISHINVYSKSTTELGRKLTNFARMTTPTANDGVFASVEAYWYWLGVAANNPKRETLRHTYGFRAKELGRELGAPDWQDGEDFRAAICATIESKIRANPDLRSALASSTLRWLPRPMKRSRRGR